jgi:choline dehydrogenase-like flavoprotein
MSLPHRGRALGELMHQYNHMVVAGLLVEDTTSGHVKVIGGRPQAFYQLAERDIVSMQKGLVLLSEMMFAAGAKKILLPFHHANELLSADDARRFFDKPIPPRSWELFTVHMMGTCAMGADRTRSVTDEFGFMHDVDRLLISDASVFPTPCRVNPMETIMTLATRSAGYVIDNAGRLFS